MFKGIVKKGQVSLFIIVGVILVLAILIPFIYLSYKQEVPIKTDAENEHIEGFIEGCIDQKAKQSLFYLGFIGGATKVNSQEPFEFFYEYDEYYKIPYHFYDGENLIKDVKIEKILESFMDNNLEHCIKNFENYKNEADFEYKEPKTDVSIKDKEVIVNVDFPVIIKREGKQSKLATTFLSKVPVRLGTIHKIGKTIVEKSEKEPSLIDWEYISDKNKDGFNITAYAGEDYTIIYRIVDNKYKIDNNEFVYQFGVKIV